jgi:hypothetical protein
VDVDQIVKDLGLPDRSALSAFLADATFAGVVRSHIAGSGSQVEFGELPIEAIAMRRVRNNVYQFFPLPKSLLSF